MIYNDFLFLHIACTQDQEGQINGSKLINQRNEICGMVVNYTTIEVCESGEWREICDATFTREDAQVVCRHLGFSAIGKLYSCYSGSPSKSTRLQ